MHTPAAKKKKNRTFSLPPPPPLKKNKNFPFGITIIILHVYNILRFEIISFITS